MNARPDNVASIHELVERGLQRVAEALIFAADAPVQTDHVADVYSEVTGEDRPSKGQVEAAIERLNEIYEKTDRVYRIEAWANGYRMATVPAVAPFLKSYFSREQQEKLSRSLMETLAIVAYRQPVTKPEVDFVRGVDSGYAMNKLLEKGLLDVVGRSESLGRPLLYGTTRFFLEQFGLKSLDNLPDLREIEEILNDPAFSRERAQLLQLQEEASVSGGAPDSTAGDSVEGDEMSGDGNGSREAGTDAGHSSGEDTHDAV